MSDIVREPTSEATPENASHPPITPEERFAKIVEALLSNPDVTPPSDGKRFGSSGLKIHNKIFAMLVGGNLVVKLPQPPMYSLIASADRALFDLRHYAHL